MVPFNAFCDHSANVENANTDSFTCKQWMKKFQRYHYTKCDAVSASLSLSVSHVHHIVPFVIAVLLTVFMLSLDSLVHSEKYLCTRVRLQGIDAFKMTLCTNAMSIQFNGRLEIQFSIISSF